MVWENSLKESIYVLTELELMEGMKSAAVVVGACPWDRSRLKRILEKATLKFLGKRRGSGRLLNS